MIDNLNTIYIVLVVQAVLGDDIWMQGDIEIRIGDKKPYNEGDIVNVDALLESMESDGEFLIFSCCCGIPECGGWEKGIRVAHRGNTIWWTDLDRGISWTFDKNRMLDDLKDIREEVAIYKQYFKEKGIEYVGVGCNW